MDATARCLAALPLPPITFAADCRWCRSSWSLSRRMTASASAARECRVKAALYHCVAQSPEAKGATETVAVVISGVGGWGRIW